MELVSLAYVVATIGAVGAARVVLRMWSGPDPARLRGAKLSADPARLPDGSEAVVRGTVGLTAPGADLSSPISRRQCVYWLVTFDELGIGGDFVELGRSEQGRPFLLTSATGVARIVPDHARIAVRGWVSLYAMSDLDSPRHNDAAIRLARSVCKQPNYPRGSSFRVTEYAVVTDVEITIKGYCTHEPDPDATDDVTGYRAALPTRAVISGTKRSPLLLCD